MGVVFQLFSAADLQKLAEFPGRLDELRQLIRDERAPSPDVRAMLKNRADEVFLQLASPPFSGPLPPPASPSPSQSLVQQLFRQEDLEQLDADPAQRETKLRILELAIRCEIDNSPYVLEIIMQKVQAWLEGLVREGLEPPPPPPAPDAVYSPFSKAYKIVRAFNPPDDPTLVERDWPWG